jgi:hypothetical protein
MNENQMIRITSVQGGRDRDRRLLMNCFFVPTSQPGFYNLFDPSGRVLLGEGVTSGQSFQFDLDRLTWTMTLEQIDARFAHGAWSNNDTDPEAEEGGEFHAQAGGGMEDGEEEEIGLKPDDVKIYEVRSDHGGDRGIVLENCYFEPIGHSGDYRLKDMEGNELHAKVTDNEPFFFHYEGQKWEMSAEFWDDEGLRKAKGDWKLLDGIDDEPDSGTFHAQAGGGLEETASYATA